MVLDSDHLQPLFCVESLLIAGVYYFSFIYLKFFTVTVFENVCMHDAYVWSCMWRSEGNVVDLVLSFHIYLDSEDETQDGKLSGQVPLLTEPTHWPCSFWNFSLASSDS